jgi:polyphosphate kinase
MLRNLDRRVELFPCFIRNGETPSSMTFSPSDFDNVVARRLLPDGSYEHLHPLDGIQAVNSQEWLLTRWRSN